MFNRRDNRAQWWVAGGAILLLLAVFGLTASGTSAAPSASASHSLATAPLTCPGAYHYFTPQPGSPPSGGTIMVGDRFTLAMMLSSGTSDITGQDAHITFTTSMLRNVNAAQTGCVVTSTVTGDWAVFDYPLQNEVCNGPGPCVMRGVTRNPGYMAWSSTTSLVSGYNGADFRTAEVAFCAAAPGQARIHWQFTPPAPLGYDTVIVDVDSNTVNVPSCYEDYILNIIPSIYTPTDTPTPSNTPTHTNTPTNTPTITPGGPTLTYTPTSCPGPYHYLVLEPGSPPSGGTVTVGDKFTLDLMINAGNITIASAQQAYYIFNPTLLQNVRATSAGCVLTSTVTMDRTVLDGTLQNEVCNGPGQCNFRGLINDPGWGAFASGNALNPRYTGPDFRAAQIAFCAIAPGQAVVRWELAPSAPPNRTTMLLDSDSNIVNVPACYRDYVINIVNPTSTPTATPTARAALAGHVIWQGRPQPGTRSALPFTLRLSASGVPAVEYTGLPTDQNGTFIVSVDGLPAGEYYYWIKNGKYLANSGTVALTGAPVTNLEIGMLRASDADDSNRISAADFVILKTSFGRGRGENGYDDRADFNGDITVSSADFTLLKQSFGLAGAQYIGRDSP